MKKTSRWPIKQLIARSQKHKFKVLLREAEKLQMIEINVFFCEPEQGPILGEDIDDVEMKYVDVNVGLILTNSTTNSL